MVERLNGRMAERRNGGIGGTIDSGGMAGWPESLPTYLIYGTRRRRRHRHLLIIYSIDSPLSPVMIHMRQYKKH